MIRSLRQRHRHLVIILGVFLPVAFAVSIVVRKQVPVMDSLPNSLVTAPVKFTETEWDQANLFTKSPVRVRLMSEPSGMEKFAIELSAAKEFVKPDLIVYWVAGNPNLTDTLSDNVILLGSFNSTPLALPDDIVKSTGRLVLFSMADNEIVDVSKPIQLNNSMK